MSGQTLLFELFLTRPPVVLVSIKLFQSARVDDRSGTPGYRSPSISPRRLTIMHRFWETDDMVRLLTTDLEERCAASASAVALACCSKRLSDIVLDTLWEQLRGLCQLMRCFPPDAWEICNGKFVRTTCSIPLALEAHWSIGLLTLPLH